MKLVKGRRDQLVAEKDSVLQSYLHGTCNMPAVCAGEALDRVQGVAVRMADRIEIGRIVEPDRLHQAA